MFWFCEYISEAVTQGIMRLNLDEKKPVVRERDMSITFEINFSCLRVWKRNFLIEIELWGTQKWKTEPCQTWLIFWLPENWKNRISKKWKNLSKFHQFCWFLIIFYIFSLEIHFFLSIFFDFEVYGILSVFNEEQAICRAGPSKEHLLYEWQTSDFDFLCDYFFVFNPKYCI